MNVIEAIKSRKSVRNYNTKVVEQDKIMELVKAGNLAANFGDIYITVIENHEFLDGISEEAVIMMKNSGNEFAAKKASIPGYSPLYGAPILIVLSAKNGNDTMGFNMASISCASENILLAATELGLGSCFVMAPIMAFKNTEILVKLKIPEGYIPLVGIVIGYTDEKLEHTLREEKNNVNYIK